MNSDWIVHDKGANVKNKDENENKNKNSIPKQSIKAICHSNSCNVM